MKKVIYATTNPGKFDEVKRLVKVHGIKLKSPRELGINLDIDETGKSLEENAVLKAETYRDALPGYCIVMSDDTGVEISALNGEPGIKVRRWKGYKMTDQEIIDYCLERLKDVPEGKRQARFRTVIAVAGKGLETKFFAGSLEGEIVSQPIAQRIEGFPFEPLFYVTEWKMMLADIYQLSAVKREGLETHRHRAVLAALPYLRQLIQPSSDTALL